MDLLKAFLQEADELLSTINDDILTLEEQPNNMKLINRIFRAAHTLKGSAGVFNFVGIVKLAHQLENVLDHLRQQTFVADEEVVDLLLTGFDTIRKLVDTIEGENDEVAVDEPLIAQLVALIAQHQLSSVDVKQEVKPKWPVKWNERVWQQAETLIALAKDGHLLWNLQFTIQQDGFFARQNPLQVIQQWYAEHDFLMFHLDDTPIPRQGEFDFFTAYSQLFVLLGSKRAERKDELLAAEHPLLKDDSVTFVAPFVFPDEKEVALDLTLQQKMLFGQVMEVLQPLTTMKQTDDEFIIRLERAYEWLSELVRLGVAPLVANFAYSVAHELHYCRKWEVGHYVPRWFTPFWQQWLQKWMKVMESGMVEPVQHLLRLVLTQRFDEIVPKTEQVAPKVVAERTESAREVSKVLKIEQEKMDEILELIGELVIAKNTLPYITKKLQQANMPQLADELKTKYGLLDRIVKDLQDTVMDVRMVPIATILMKFNRLIRDTAKQVKKQVKFETIGKETRLDKDVVEALSEPLIHIIRNSIDHGLECPEQRLERGKRAEGTITVEAWQEGEHAYIDIRDDGRGVNIAKVKEIIAKKQLVAPEELDRLSDDDIVQYIFRPGFSTATEVTNLSGRGVGMDSVMSAIEQLKGDVTVTSKSGEGTSVLLKLPLSLAMTKVLQIRVGTALYGIPLEQTIETVKVARKQLQTMGGRPILLLRGKLYPVVKLKYFLHMREAYEAPQGSFVILQSGIALEVDHFLGQIEVVVKAVDAHLARLAYLAGAAIMGDGSILFVLNTSVIK